MGKAKNNLVYSDELLANFYSHAKKFHKFHDSLVDVNISRHEQFLPNGCNKNTSVIRLSRKLANQFMSGKL